MLEYIDVPPRSLDFLFKLKDDFYLCSLKYLEKILQHLGLSPFFVQSRYSIKDKELLVMDVYKDGERNSVVFECRPRRIEIELKDHKILLSVYKVNPEVDIVGDGTRYKLNIRPLLDKYVNNQKIEKLAEYILKEKAKRNSMDLI